MRTVREVKNRIVKHRQAIETEQYKIEGLERQLARTALLDNKVRLTDEIKRRRERIERRSQLIEVLEWALEAPDEKDVLR